MPNKIKLSFRFLSFKTISFQYSEPKEEYKRLRNGQYEFKINLSVNPEKEHVYVRMISELFVGKEERQSIARIHTASTFKVNGVKKLPMTKNKVDLPTIIAGTLLSLHYSTTRGALVEKGAGTLIEKMVMPVKRTEELLPPKENSKNEKK